MTILEMVKVGEEGREFTRNCVGFVIHMAGCIGNW